MKMDADNKVKLKQICDKCFHQLSDDEPMFAFKLVDDEDYERTFKGHESCVNEMVEIMQRLYGKGDKDNE